MTWWCLLIIILIWLKWQFITDLTLSRSTKLGWTLTITFVSLQNSSLVIAIGSLIPILSHCLIMIRRYNGLMVRPQASFDARRPRDIFWMITNLPIITGLYLVMRTLTAHYVQTGDAARVIRPVLMVRALVCHWVMTIKSPLIAADHCWLLWFPVPALTLAVQCPVRECGGPQQPAGSPARARLRPPAQASPARSPPLLSIWHWPLWSPHSSLHTSHSPWNSLGCQPLPSSSRPPLALSWTGPSAERDE